MMPPLPRPAAPLALVLMLAGCNPPPAADAPARTTSTKQVETDAGAAPVDRPVADAPPPAAAEPTAPAPANTAPAATLAARELVLTEWRKAENRNACEPMTLARDSAGGTPRRANFAGGWAIAFDKPGLRSAYGIAGPGMLPQDENAADWQRERLQRQWPHFRDLNGAVKGFAGYGIEGAGAYPAGNPEGKGAKSLAYVRIDGQSCTYNVWSQLGRAHLEAMLDALTPIPY